jgi:hypothetical protein
MQETTGTSVRTDFIRFDSWSMLEGVEAQVWQHGELLRTCTVDAATSDSAIAWTVSDVHDGRRLIDKASGYELRIGLEQLIRRRQR